MWTKSSSRPWENGHYATMANKISLLDSFVCQLPSFSSGTPPPLKWQSSRSEEFESRGSACGSATLKVTHSSNREKWKFSSFYKNTTAWDNNKLKIFPPHEQPTSVAPSRPPLWGRFCSSCLCWALVKRTLWSNCAAPYCGGLFLTPERGRSFVNFFRRQPAQKDGPTRAR